MMYKTTIYFLSCILFLFNLQQLQAQQTKPNIILIVADDLGYSDIGCYGGEVSTPALNKLSKEGIRLANMHNAAMCVVSRSSLLTGKWWPKAGAGITTGNNIAQQLQQAGYRTGLVGKWHLNGEPNDKGFGYFFGFLGGFSSYYEGSKDYRLNKKPFTDFGKNYYSTDAFTDRAIEFIKPVTGVNQQPFFLYLAYQSPHNPLQAPRADIMKYRGTYLKGWQAIRNARIKNQIKFGIIKPGTPLPAYPQNLPDWEALTPAQKDLEDLRMSVYAAMIERMDHGIERLMKALEANGQMDNTFILFLSDNGTDPFSSADPAMIKRGLLPGDNNSNYQPGTGWAYVGATPHRLYKISQHEGGVKTGAIAWYPKHFKGAGSINATALHVVDIVPAIMQLAMPSPAAGKVIAGDIDGQSFLGLLKGEKMQRKSPMFFQYMDNRAVRTGKWTLVEVDGSGWELYDINKDPQETNDLAKKFPTVVNELDKTWLKWWNAESKTGSYIPASTASAVHYKPQGDRGTGKPYNPTAMPAELSGKYK